MMGRRYHDGVTQPYESTGRTAQKSRTRLALVTATRALLAAGRTPTVEDAAERAGISRTTAYRYFPNQRSLLLAAHPTISPETLLPADAPTDPKARLDVLMAAFTHYNFTWEPQLRELFGAYVEAKQAQNVLDYDDLLLYWAGMAAEPALAEHLGGRFDHVLVDEYQDTNRLQASIPPSPSMTARIPPT